MTAPLVRAALAALAPLALLALAAPALRIGPAPSLALAYAAAAGAILAAVALAPYDALARRDVALAAGALGVALSLVALALPPVASGLAGSAGVLACGCALGCAVGARIASPGHLLAVALVSSAVDIWSVTAPSGVTHTIVETPLLLRLLTVRVAVPPVRAPEPMIGFGDVVFAALYHAAATRHGLSRARTLGALAVGLALAGVGAGALGLEGGIPALPFLGIAVVLAHPEARRVPAKDRRATAFAAAVLVAAIVRVALR